MRLLGASVVLFTACLPVEPGYLITAPSFRGVRLEVVEPGGYASLLNAPPGRPRATFLPLDTIELTAHFAAPPGVDIQPPIWLYCGADCSVHGPLAELVGDVAVCPTPLPLNLSDPCRLDEAMQIRVSIAGAFTFARPELPLLLIGSRDPDLTPATCLERLTRRPHTDLEPCIVAHWGLRPGPRWALLPFAPDTAAIPREIVEQEVDTNPDIVGFRVTRQRGADRREQLVDPGARIGVRRGERITVEPLFTAESAQQYWLTYNDEEGKPYSGELRDYQEELTIRPWFDAPVLGLDWETYDDWREPPLTWIVPDNVEPTRLFLDVMDDRAGRASAELLFVADDAP